ncbi:MAG: DJ-1/PfpI family protein [Oscillospiraceae bacterium]|jgi:4-methyl-5(b-hydroxyethyl)-thiazole monophosphate biosynthesis|nr:DJ-1/PfpI family protein [Oscillospiraceae bacterium]
MVYVLLAQGFEEVEAIAPIDLLRRVNVDVQTVSLTDDLLVQGGHDIIIKADITLEQVDIASMEMLVLPGGLGGVNTINDNPAAMELIKTTWNANKKIAAICAAPTLLAKHDIIKGKSLVCHPSVGNTIMAAGGRLIYNKQVVCDGNLITAKTAGSSIEFALELITILCDRETSEQIRYAIT